MAGDEETSNRSGGKNERREATAPPAQRTIEPPPSRVEALDGTNYEDWSSRMKSAFKRYRLLKVALGKETMPPAEGEEQDKWVEKSAVVYDLILQAVNPSMLQHIKDLVEDDESGPKAWKVLENLLQPNTMPMVIILEQELAAVRMKPGDEVEPVLNRLKDIYTKMSSAGAAVEPMKQCVKIISVLDNSWGNLIPTLNSQQALWTPEWVRQQILQEDFRRKHAGGGGEAASSGGAEGYGAAGAGRGKGGGRGRGRGKGSFRGGGRGNAGGRGSTRMEGACWYCKKTGHPWFKCHQRPEGWAPPGMAPPSGERATGGAAKGGSSQGQGKPDSFLMVKDVEEEGAVEVAGKVEMHPLTHWVIDSGCTSHMTPRADLLEEVRPPGKVKFVTAASGTVLPVIGVGDAMVKGARGELVGLGNVLLVKGLTANLLSVRRLQKSKARVTFGPAYCEAKLGSKVLWNLGEKTSCINNLWQLPAIPWSGTMPEGAGAAADEEPSAEDDGQPHGAVLAGVSATAAWAKATPRSGEADWETWHERLGHINFTALQRLVKSGNLRGMAVKGVDDGKECLN